MTRLLRVWVPGGLVGLLGSAGVFAGGPIGKVCPPVSCPAPCPAPCPTPGPKIVVIQDLDKPEVLGSFWGEVNASVHRALGCVGTITDGAIRDVDEMTAAGFKAIARRFAWM